MTEPKNIPITPQKRFEMLVAEYSQGIESFRDADGNEELSRIESLERWAFGMLAQLQIGIEVTQQYVRENTKEESRIITPR